MTYNIEVAPDTYKGMDMRRKIIFLLSALMLPLLLQAEESTLVVELSNGNKSYFKLQEKPIVRMSDGRVYVESNRVETSFLISNVAKFFFSSEGTAVDDIARDDFLFTQSGDNQYTISNIQEREQIIVSDSAGRLYNRCISVSGNEVLISLEGCPKGIYVIKVGNKQTIKIIKR